MEVVRHDETIFLYTELGSYPKNDLTVIVVSETPQTIPNGFTDVVSINTQFSPVKIIHYPVERPA